MKSTIIIATAVAALSFSMGASAADRNAAETAKNLCAGCHGPNGISVNPLWPNLAGQKAAYISKAMSDYKAGLRNDPSMSAIAATVSDAEIITLGEYYAALPPGG